MAFGIDWSKSLQQYPSYFSDRWPFSIDYFRYSKIAGPTSCAYKILCTIILHFDVLVSMGGPIALLFHQRS
ncbi:hypothetical protein BofuT4_P043570.1 [Botrytis cinerea T4]|uniref:Uncharacterized protein n=1 Tax=Botryotinia fuckeliana (strain T4) TaxID=999810 RepID=G2Y016_BOTF4|nr:hypothetical protein BofuT4_P043570.1 [Botrytis cinerea T4]